MSFWDASNRCPPAPLTSPGRFPASPKLQGTGTAVEPEQASASLSYSTWPIPVIVPIMGLVGGGTPRDLVRLSTKQSVGDRLRAAREARGLSVDKAAETTRIPPAYLEALERTAPPEEFPEPWYARAFLREYARYLGLRSKPLVEDYRERYPRRDISPIGYLPLERKRGAGWLRTALVLLAGAALIATTLVVVARRGPSPDLTADRPSFPASASPQPVQTATAEPTPVPPDDVVLRVRVVEAPSWIQLSRDGEVELSETVLPGYVRTFKADQRLDLELGNAPAVHLTLGGEAFEITDDVGGVWRGSFVLRQDRVRVVPLIETEV
jgi:transcriptional regulator with XRE-family HTH domain